MPWQIEICGYCSQDILRDSHPRDILYVLIIIFHHCFKQISEMPAVEMLILRHSLGNIGIRYSKPL